MSILIDKDTTVNKVIDQILQENTLAHFQIDNDERFSCVIHDEAAATVITLRDCHIKRIGTPQYQKSKLFAEAGAYYNKPVKSGDGQYTENTDNKESMNYENEIYEKKTITLLTPYKEDADAWLSAFLSIYGEIQPYVPIVTDMRMYNRWISENVTVTVGRPKAIALGTWTGEIVKTEFNPDNMECTTLLRFFKEEAAA